MQRHCAASAVISAATWRILIVTVKSMLAKLKTLANCAGETLHERVRLASAINADREWLEEACNGDEYQAAEILAEHFQDVCHGRLNMLSLLNLYNKMPDLKDWRKYRFNVMAMLDAIAINEDRVPSDRRRATIKDIEERDDKIKELEYHVTRDKQELGDKVAEIEKLRVRIGELSEENARLRGRIEQMEKVMNRELAA